MNKPSPVPPLLLNLNASNRLSLNSSGMPSAVSLIVIKTESLSRIEFIYIKPS